MFDNRRNEIYEYHDILSLHNSQGRIPHISLQNSLATMYCIGYFLCFVLSYPAGSPFVSGLIRRRRLGIGSASALHLHCMR
jgi:hypothetical protein